MSRKLFQKVSLLGLLLEVGSFYFQLFEGERLNRRFHVNSKRRQGLTVFGIIATFLYGSFQICQLITRFPSSIDQAALDFVWILGNVGTFTISLNCLWNGQDIAAFSTQFLLFVQRFKGKYIYLYICTLRSIFTFLFLNK